MSELDWLEAKGVIEKTIYSEWTAPIVAVLKRDRCLRLRGYYNISVNPNQLLDEDYKKIIHY